VLKRQTGKNDLTKNKRQAYSTTMNFSNMYNSFIALAMTEDETSSTQPV
jgi:hypothetical protein